MDESTRPTGTVTFLFSDIEGSTELASRLSVATYREVVEQHQRLLRSAFGKHVGVERGTDGDSFFVVFRDARSAVAAAVDAQRSLDSAEWPDRAAVRVRMGLHSGEGVPGGDDYVGLDVNRAARIAAAAHGGQILISDATRALSQGSMPEGVEARDLGEHRLKGLASPMRLFQLVIVGLASDFPQIRSLEVQSGNLPPRLTSFVGRDLDVEVVLRLLGQARLLSVIGPGGTGKTSLSIEVARAAAGDFADGAWFVPLESLSDPALVATAIVSALGMRDLTGRSARMRLLENLPGRSILLVVDNFEHLLDAAGLMGEIVASAPGTKAIVTSRAPLHLAAEQVYPLTPLAVPEQGDALGPEQLAAIPSVRLFVDRARRVRPAFVLTADNAEAVSDICLLLDGLPLGIELAAARIALLGPVGIRDRLSRQAGLGGPGMIDVPSRQRTLSGAIAWSHGLLDPPGRMLFARLSVFAGGWRLDEAEVVCGPSAELGAEVFDSLAALVDQSLVATRDGDGGSVRYLMLETIRAFASERLGESPDERATIRRRHAMAYIEIAESNAPQLESRAQPRALDRLAAELDNLRTAIRWSIDAGEAELGLRLVAALWRFWKIRGDMEEGRSTVAEVLAMSGGEVTAARMSAMEAAGGLFYYSGDHAQANEMYRAQLDLARRLGDRKGVADARYNLSFTEFDRERAMDMLPTIEEIAVEYRTLGDERSVARTEWSRAAILLASGRAAEAVEAWRRLVPRFHELDDVPYESMTAGSVGFALFRMGEHAAAAPWLIYGLAPTHAVGDIALMMLSLPAAAIAALAVGKPEAAATILGASEANTHRYGVRPPRGLVQLVRDWDPVAQVRKELDDATYNEAYRRGHQMTLEEIATFALGLVPAAIAAETSA